jgi:hypothetical protein
LNLKFKQKKKPKIFLFQNLCKFFESKKVTKFVKKKKITGQHKGTEIISPPFKIPEKTFDPLPTCCESWKLEKATHKPVQS